MMTAPTSGERREVAATLRDAKRKCDGRGYPWMTDDLILAIGYEHDYEADNGIFDRLAELIDPTCEMDDAGDVPASVKDNLNTFFCSECGAPVYNDMIPSYCPQCGSRVTNGGER